MRPSATRALARLLGITLLLVSCAAAAQPRQRAIENVDVQKLANGILGIMSYTVTPDVTTSSLSVSNATQESANLTLTQIGGGFTWSASFPLYLEGNAAYSRFDPVFVASDGTEQRRLPTRWNSVSATGGIGWDFKIAEHWTLRPIFNFMIGEVASDVDVARWWVQNNLPVDLAFLDHGKLRAYGVGGALMLDYERFAPEWDDDLEVRYSNVELRGRGDTSFDVQAHGKAESISIWARRRIPTGWGTFMDRPVRYVYEVAHTHFYGNETDAGLPYMSSVGFGLEFDSSARDLWATRWRAVARYKFGPGLAGWSLGLAVSF